MKLIALISILVLVLFACTKQKQTAEFIMLEGAEENAKISADLEVRLTEHGFDSTNIVVGKGSSLTVFVEDEISKHYLAIDSYRIADIEYKKGDRIDIPFTKIGKFILIDETSGNSVNVFVQ